MLRKAVPELDLRRLQDVEPQLIVGFADWEVLLGVKQHGARGLITCDANMIWSPRVVAVVEQTRFALVACEESGDDPVVATGLVLAHLPRVARRLAYKPQIWRLHPTEQRPLKFPDHRSSVEKRAGVRIRDFKLSKSQLARPIPP